MMNSRALKKRAESNQLEKEMPLFRGEQEAELTESNYLCHDVLTKVLSLVPLASAIRFQCVNSSWRHLILYDPSLESLRRRAEDHQRVIGFYYTSTNDTEPLHFQPLSQLPLCKFEDQLDRFQCTRATCGGLVLICCAHGYFVRNPMTKITVIVPPPPLQQVSKCYGLATSAEGFEIVCVNASSDSAAFVYSSSLGDSWTPLAMDSKILKLLIGKWPFKTVLIPTLNYVNPFGAAFAGQSLHWLLHDGRIAVLNIKALTWRLMESPAVGKVVMYSWYFRYVDACLNGGLHNYKFNFDSYPNIWFGSVGSHLYLVMVINEMDLQLWMLENYDGGDWKMIVDVKGSSSHERIKPLLFDGRRIGITFFKDWSRQGPVMRFFDTFNMKWQDDKISKRERDNLITDKFLKSVWFYFPCIRE